MICQSALEERASHIMVNVEIHGDDVIVKVIGSHKIWALKSEIRFEKSNIVSIEKTGPELQPPLLFRVGTALPGFICAGTLSGRQRKEFWDRTKNGRGICIELVDTEYDRIVVDVQDPADAISRLS
jgi:hypothetical protein